MPNRDILSHQTADDGLSNELIFTTKEPYSTARAGMLHFFTLLNQRDHDQLFNGRLWRSQIRRMAEYSEALIHPAYFYLCYQLGPHLYLKSIDRLALALFIKVVAYVENECHQDQQSKSFARQLGSRTNKDGNRPALSPLRFARLQRAATPDAFCQQLIQAVRLRGAAGINVISLADGIFLWMREWHAKQTDASEITNPLRRVQIRWGTEYLLASQTSH